MRAYQPRTRLEVFNPEQLHLFINTHEDEEVPCQNRSDIFSKVLAQCFDMDIVHLAGSLHAHDALELTDIHAADFPRLSMGNLVYYFSHLSCTTIRDAQTIIEAFNCVDKIRSWYRSYRTTDPRRLISWQCSSIVSNLYNPLSIKCVI